MNRLASVSARVAPKRLPKPAMPPPYCGHCAVAWSQVASNPAETNVYVEYVCRRKRLKLQCAGRGTPLFAVVRGTFRLAGQLAVPLSIRVSPTSAPGVSAVPVLLGTEASPFVCCHPSAAPESRNNTKTLRIILRDSRNMTAALISVVLDWRGAAAVEATRFGATSRSCSVDDHSTCPYVGEGWSSSNQRARGMITLTCDLHIVLACNTATFTAVLLT